MERRPSLVARDAVARAPRAYREQPDLAPTQLRPTLVTNVGGVVDSYKLFTLVDDAASKWRGRRGEVAAAEKVPRPAGATGEEMARRRAAFFKYSEAVHEEQRKQAAAQRRSAAHVRSKIEKEVAHHHIARPLRRFGAKMMVVVVYHCYSSKTKQESKQRRLVVMDDALKWDKFEQWLTTSVLPTAKQVRAAAGTHARTPALPPH